MPTLQHATSAASTQPLRMAEFRQILHLAWPILVALLAQHAMGFVDTLMSARAGTLDLAAIALGSSLWLPLSLTFSGLLMATTPLVAHSVGADREPDTATPLIQGVLISLLLSAAAVVLLNQSEAVLNLMSLEPALSAKTAHYLSAVSWGSPALLLFQVLRSLSEGFGQPRPMMRIALIGLLCNIPLNYILIFGKLGLPAMGGVGCGYATSIVMWIMLALSLLYLIKAPRFHQLRYHLFRQQRPFATLGSYLHLGVPIGAALLIEASMFCVIALLIAGDGPVVIAAHQITFSVSELTFMFPLSLAMALTIRVGHLRGGAKLRQARFSAFCGLQLAFLVALASCAILKFEASWIASLYTDRSDISSLAVHLLGIAALFQLADGLQVSAAGALRGYKDTSWVLACVFLAYWMIGLPSGYLLARTLELGVSGYWYGLLIGLLAGATFLTLRLQRISHVSTPLYTVADNDSAECL